MSTTTTTTSLPSRSNRALTLSVVIAPLVWFAHFVAVWALVEFSCMAGGLPGAAIIGLSPQEFAVIVLTGLALVAPVLGGWQSYRMWQSARDQDTADKVVERQRFMASLGVTLSLIFALTMLATAIPVFFLRTCEAVTG